MLSDILNRAQLVRREFFDPKNPAHVQSLKTYLRTGNWGDIQFFAELPYIEVPMSVMRKYLEHHLQIVPETQAELQDRLAAKNLVNSGSSRLKLNDKQVANLLKMHVETTTV